MTATAQVENTRSAGGFTTVQAYTLAIITLVIGIAMGYFARGSASPAAPTETAQTMGSPAAGAAGMGSAQLPGIGSNPTAAGGFSRGDC